MRDIEFFFIYYGMYIVYAILLFIILKMLLKKTIKEYHSNWNTLIDNFEYSPKEFYSQLKTELESHGITGITIKEKHIKTGGAFSVSRIYLRAIWKGYQYDICGCKYGKGFFISWWLLLRNPIGKTILLRIPYLGKWLAQKFYPITYYTVDTASMFMSYAQSSVLKVIDDITNEKGVRTLSESDRKPILNDIFKR